MLQKALIIAAHPDDEVLGCGGLLSQQEIDIEILGQGRGSDDDNQFDKYPLLEWIKKIELIIKKYIPTIIFTHHEHDLNIDHRIIFQAVKTAIRNTRINLLCFEIPGSTPIDTFKPAVCLPIEPDKKWEKCLKYKNEMRKFPHPRSYKYIEALSIIRGSVYGMEYAEAYEVIRSC